MLCDMCVFGAPRGYLGLANISNVGATSLPPETSPLSFCVPLSILILFGINMLCLLIFVATVVAATSTLVTFLLFLHLFFASRHGACGAAPPPPAAKYF